MKEITINRLYLWNKFRLEQMIENDAPYDKILQQSMRLDKYINLQMKYLNKK